MLDLAIVGICVTTAIACAVVVMMLSNEEKKRLREENFSLKKRCEKYRHACEYLLERNL